MFVYKIGDYINLSHPSYVEGYFWSTVLTFFSIIFISKTPESNYVGLESNSFIKIDQK